MKKSLLALAVLALSGSAFACGYGQTCSTPSSSGSTTASAGAQVSTTASASSAGNGFAYSKNSASASGAATGFNTQGATFGGITSIGSAAVGGVAATSGKVTSESLSYGNAVANGYADAAACAQVDAKATYAVNGKQPIAGTASGQAGSTTGFSVATSAGVGGGHATAAQEGGTLSAFNAGAESIRIGAYVNLANADSSATSLSATAPAVNIVTGNASTGYGGSAGYGGTGGDASALANAKAGNLCSTTLSCSNSIAHN